MAWLTQSHKKIQLAQQFVESCGRNLAPETHTHTNPYYSRSSGRDLNLRPPKPKATGRLRLMVSHRQMHLSVRLSYIKVRCHTAMKHISCKSLVPQFPHPSVKCVINHHHRHKISVAVARRIEPLPLSQNIPANFRLFPN